MNPGNLLLGRTAPLPFFSALGLLIRTQSRPKEDNMAEASYKASAFSRNPHGHLQDLGSVISAAGEQGRLRGAALRFPKQPRQDVSGVDRRSRRGAARTNLQMGCSIPRAEQKCRNDGESD